MDKSVFITGTAEKYDKRLLENRITIEGNVCGCLLKDLTLLDDSGLKAEDFLTVHGRMLYRIVESLRSKAFTECDEVTYISNVSEEIRNKIEDEIGGWRQIGNLIDVVSIKNWDAFLDNLNKSNVLLALYKKGFNLFDNITLDNGKIITPVEFFKKLTSNEVVEYYEGTLATLETRVNSSKIVEEGYIDFDEAWLKSVQEQQEMGVYVGNAGNDIYGEEIRTFPFMSNNLLGLKPGTMSAFAAQSGTGKTTYMVTMIMSLISQGEKVLMVTNESRLSELKAIFLIWVLYRCIGYKNMSKRRFLSGANFTDEDHAALKKAKQYWQEHYAKNVKIITLSDADASLSAQVIKKHIVRDGFTTFLVDTMKMTISEAKDDGSWMSLIRDARLLTEVALKYNVIGLLTLQLAPSMENRLWLDVSCLANCKQIKETLSNLIMFRKLKPDELDPESKIYIKPFRRKQNENGEWYSEPYDADPNKQWIIMFTDKCRRGIDSGMDGTAFLCRSDLDHASFYETARCYPSRKTYDETR